MNIGGYNKETDYSKLGTSMLIAACVILAVRTARWPVRREGTTSDVDLQAEVDNAILLANRVLGALLRDRAHLFPSKQVPWYLPDDEDVLK